MSTLAETMARKARQRFGVASEPGEPLAYHRDGEPALRAGAPPARRRRSASIDTTIYPEHDAMLNRIIDAIRARGNRRITKSEIIERGIAAIAREEGIG